MALSGYSGTPLAKKPGIKEGSRLGLVNRPSYYLGFFTDMPQHIQLLYDKKQCEDLAQLGLIHISKALFFRGKL